MIQLMILTVAAAALAGGDFDCDWQTIDGGGITFATGGSYELGGTIGQPDAGVTLTGGGYDLTGGFWSIGASGSACQGDLDGSGEVDGADLGLLLANWDEAGLGDLDGSGVVDGADLGLLLAAWGPC
jgi:hypothetical protein